MRTFRRVVAIGLAVVMALGLGIFGVSELGGEIVTLGTSSASGDASTRIWVVDDAGHAWLRAGAPSNGWLVRIDANPDVTIERAGQRTRYKAVPVRDDPTLRDRIHALMREKYTWADRIVSMMRDGSHSVPIRLDPVEPGAAPLS